MIDSTASAPPTASATRRRSFRLAAVLLPLILLLIAEGTCRLAGWGQPALAPDPFVGFSELHPLFEVDTERRIHRIVPSRRKFFAYESFAIDKPVNSRRVFCLGGSTVKGEPYSIPTSFTTWLELALNAADDDLSWEVVNCGGISYASYRLIPILQECLAYQPDLFIICTGHNEFLEDRTYGHLKDPGAVATAARSTAGRSHLVTLARQRLTASNRDTFSPIDTNRPILGPETDPILDYNDSLRAYHWDDNGRRGIVAHFEFNLRRMADLARQAGVPLIYVLPPSNLAGCPPFKAEHHPALSAADESQFQALTQSARAHYANDLKDSILHLTAACRISPGNAEALYDLGQCHLAAGSFVAARNWLIRARDNDVVPLRMISALETAMRQVAVEQAVPLLDAHELLESQTQHHVLDDSLLVDHIHPGFAGHQAIAAALLRIMSKQAHVGPRDDWEPLANSAWTKHFESLEYPYFAQGQRMLRSLEGWTQGRGDGPPAAERFPWRIPPAPPGRSD